MTGSNRLLLGFGWPLVVIVTLIVANRGQADDEQEEEFVGTAKLIADMHTAPRRGIVIAMFIGAASIILMAAEPFATALVESGTTLGIDSYFLVQWLAPLASEAPEFIIAVLFALRAFSGWSPAVRGFGRSRRGVLSGYPPPVSRFVCLRVGAAAADSC
jgi:cation:H+ antiporter